jgi:hypothetical protein
MLTRLTIGSTVRRKPEGDLFVVDGLDEIAGVPFVILTKFGHLSGTVPTDTERIPVRRDQVVLQRLTCEWEDDE